jgi:hypothetical protein
MSEPAEVVPLVDRAHVLYRMYDRAQQLLYVGITFDPRARWRAHGEDKFWWTDVASIEIKHFRSRVAAERAERRSIQSDRPLYNVIQYVPKAVRPDVIPPKKHRNVRMDGDIWWAASRIADLQGESISIVVRTLLARYVARNRKLLDEDPDWPAWRASKGD